MTEIQKKKAEWLRRPYYIKLQMMITQNPEAVKKEYEAVLREVEEVLSQIENPFYREILRAYYVEGIKLGYIIKKSCYSTRTMIYTKARALDMLNIEGLSEE